MFFATLLQASVLALTVHAKTDHRLDYVETLRPTDSLARFLLAIQPTTRFQSSRRLSSPRHHQRADSDVTMILDWLKDKMPKADDASVREDQLTPFDKFMGTKVIKGDGSDSEDADSVGAAPEQQYVDPTDASNYMTLVLEKPMGIVLEEKEEGESMSVVVTGLKEDGSASKSTDPPKRNDLLVGVDGTNARNVGLDKALDLIGSASESVKLTFFRGPAKFLYGPTAPSEEWYQDLLETRAK